MLTIAKIGVAGSALGLVPGLFLNGAGTGLAVSPLASTVLSRMGGHHAGAASGVLTTGLQVGNAVGMAVIGIIFYGALRQPPSNHAHAINVALLYLIAMSVGLMGLVQLLPSRRSGQSAQSPV